MRPSRPESSAGIGAPMPVGAAAAGVPAGFRPTQRCPDIPRATERSRRRMIAGLPSPRSRAGARGPRRACGLACRCRRTRSRAASARRTRLPSGCAPGLRRRAAASPPIRPPSRRASRSRFSTRSHDGRGPIPAPARMMRETTLPITHRMRVRRCLHPVREGPRLGDPPGRLPGREHAIRFDLRGLSCPGRPGGHRGDRAGLERTGPAAVQPFQPR